MALDKATERDLIRFKRYRDELIHADAANFEHHVREFVREIDQNALVAAIRARLPHFDVDAWWNANVLGPAQRTGRLRTIEFPADESERLVTFLDLASAMASEERTRRLSLSGLGQLLGRSKSADVMATAIALVFRPLADLLGDRIREQVEVANPAVRELAGVPLDRVPNEGETKIFLSHKSVDKDIVRPFYEVLAELGLDPWLDEKDMKAGDTLHREIADGFDRSCAVVFFVTPNFKDERWLRREVDHAVHRKVERQDRFAIITLAFDGAEVPRPLQENVWVPVKSHASAVREILRALPIQVGPSRWRK